MKRIAGIISMAAAGLLLAATPVRADDGWKQIAILEANGKKDAKEVSVDHKTEHIRVKCTEGSVIINTITVRANGKAEPHKVGKRLGKDEEYRFDLDGKTQVEGLRISDDGKGKYMVMYKK